MWSVQPSLGFGFPAGARWDAPSSTNAAITITIVPILAALACKPLSPLSAFAVFAGTSSVGSRIPLRFRVVVEPFPGFPAVVPGEHHLPQQGRGGVPGILELREHRLGD